MSNGLEKLLARRLWFVPDVMIWGTVGLGELDYLVLEQTGADRVTSYGFSSYVDGQQKLLFGQMTDHRGNQLPNTIASPRVLIRARGSDPVFVIGREGPDGVTLARSSASVDPVMADLLVVEMGD